MEYFKGSTVRLAGYTSGIGKNSTDTLLPDATTFSGGDAAWEDVSSFVSIVISLLTDRDTIVTAQFSGDKTNVDEEIVFNATASVNLVRLVAVTRRFYRIKIENASGGAQTFMRAASTYGYLAPGSALSSGASTLPQVANTGASTLITVTTGGGTDPAVAGQQAVTYTMLSPGTIHYRLGSSAATTANAELRNGDVLRVVNYNGPVSFIKASGASASVQKDVTSVT